MYQALFFSSLKPKKQRSKKKTPDLRLRIDLTLTLTFHPFSQNETQNMVTYWTTADFANRETCSFIRLNDAFQKTLLQADKKKSRKLTNQGKQLLPGTLISNVIVFYHKERIIGNDS